MAKAPAQDPKTEEVTETVPAQDLKTEEAAEAAAETHAPAHGELLTVETTGAFMLMDPLTGTIIEADGPTDVVYNSFIENKLSENQLKLVG